MSIATVTSKGQITIPAETRARLRLIPGSKVSFEENAAGETVLRAKRGDVRALKGFFNYEGPPKTLEQIEEGIASEIAERAARR